VRGNCVRTPLAAGILPGSRAVGVKLLLCLLKREHGGRDQGGVPRGGLRARLGGGGGDGVDWAGPVWSGEWVGVGDGRRGGTGLDATLCSLDALA
jgi:hypothetical protein